MTMVLSEERMNRICVDSATEQSRKSVKDDNSTLEASRADVPEQRQTASEEMTEERPQIDYAASIERVKDCGWYWGSISGGVAEQLLQNEPDGSFLVRDSSDEHHIFSLSLRLTGEVRHVRIEHHGGNFSFGFGNKFHSTTIIDFVENAVHHSRSGRYLFFLNRMPMLGPMRVQLLYPVSRFKRMSSLQHLCRMTIFRELRQRRDLISELPLPKKLLAYLDTPNYLIEMDPCEPLVNGPTPPATADTEQTSM